jgi:hypothetical protein
MDPYVKVRIKRTIRISRSKFPCYFNAWGDTIAVRAFSVLTFTSALNLFLMGFLTTFIHLPATYKKRKLALLIR